MGKENSEDIFVSRSQVGYFASGNRFYRSDFLCEIFLRKLELFDMSHVPHPRVRKATTIRFIMMVKAAATMTAIIIHWIIISFPLPAKS